MPRTKFVSNVPVPPARFVGRVRQIDEILDHLIAARGSSAISGDPRVGKTSLLHYLCSSELLDHYGLSTESCCFVYVDCHNITPFSEATFWKYILLELEQRLENHRPLTARIQTLLSKSILESRDLVDLSVRIDRVGYWVVLILDEFESVIKNLDPNSLELLYHLRALLNWPERGLTLIVSSRESLAQLCAGFDFTGSPFDNSFSSVILPPFSEDEVGQLLNKYQANLSTKERGFLRQMAGTHPYLVQLVGGHILRRRIDGTSFAQIKEKLEQQTEYYFFDILRYCSNVEKMLLIWLALVQLVERAPSDIPSLAKLPQTLGRYDRDLRRLARRGWVRNQPDAVLFSPIMGRWVLEKELVEAERDVAVDWLTHFDSYLSSEQQALFKNVIETVIKWPVVITNPDLLPKYFTPKQASSAPTRSIRLSGPVYAQLDDAERNVIKELYSTGEQSDIAEVRLEKNFTGGLSGAKVILAEPIDERSRSLAHQVVKIAPGTMLRREYSRYRRFVKGRLPATAVRLENLPVELGDKSSLSYGFAGDRPIGAVKDLESYYRGRSADDVKKTLTRLMESLDVRWYGQMETMASSYADQYGQQLPAHLEMAAEQISPKQLSGTDAYRFIDLQTVFDDQYGLKIGERVVLTGLQVSQVTPDTVKMCSTGDGATIWVRASVDTFYRNLNEKDQVCVMGMIQSRRDDVLKAAVANIFNFMVDMRRLPDGSLQIEGLAQPVPNPLDIYRHILKQPLNGRKSIIHGDLHPGNILVDESGRAWLIDFDHVREAHVLYDFVRLETILRLFILGNVRPYGKETSVVATPETVHTEWPHSFSLAQYVAFENHLLRQSLGQTPPDIDDAELQKLADVILTIRHLAKHYLRQSNKWHEYLCGLFLQNLAQLRFYQDEPWLGVLPFVTAAIVGDAIGEQ